MEEVTLDIQEHWEKDGVYYVKTNYGELSTTSRLEYESAVKDGFIVLKISSYHGGDAI